MLVKTNQQLRWCAALPFSRLRCGFPLRRISRNEPAFSHSSLLSALLRVL